MRCSGELVVFWKVLLEDSGGVQEPAGLLRATKRGEVAADALVEHAGVS